MQHPIAYCGLNCEACDAYLATIHDDEELREKTAELWSRLNQVRILPEHIRCMGCREDGVKTVFCEDLCEIRRCAVGKGVDTCDECPEAEICRTLGAVRDQNPDAFGDVKTDL